MDSSIHRIVNETATSSDAIRALIFMDLSRHIPGVGYTYPRLSSLDGIGVQLNNNLSDLIQTLVACRWIKFSVHRLHL